MKTEKQHKRELLKEQIKYSRLITELHGIIELDELNKIIDKSEILAKKDYNEEIEGVKK